MRTRSAGVLVVVLAIVAVSLFWSTRRSPTPPPKSLAATPEPRAQGTDATAPVEDQHALVSEILTQGLTPGRAEALFSLMVGPLPGVPRPSAGSAPYDFDGTLAVNYIFEVWGSLTEDQRTAAMRLIYGKQQPPTVRSGAWWSAPGDRPRLARAAYDPPYTPPFAFDYQAMAVAGKAAIAAALASNGAAVPSGPFSVEVDNDKPPADEYAHTWSWWLWEPGVGGEKFNKAHQTWKPLPDGCTISVHNQQFVGLPQIDAQSIMTHEMFHCYQQWAAGNGATMVSVPKWISEGEATWVQFALSPGSDAGDYLLKGIWKFYVLQPATTYSMRSYDGVGVFGHLRDIAGDPTVWSRLLPLVLTGSGNNSATALKSLLQGYEDKFFTQWGSSYFDIPGGLVEWTMTGPGPVPSKAAPPDDITIDSGFNQTLPVAQHHESKMFQLTGTADIATISLLTGYGRLHDQSWAVDSALDASAPVVLCLKQGGCKCPDGSDGASLWTTKATTPVSVGINGGWDTASVAVVGASLDDFCKQPDPPGVPPNPPGGGGGGGGGGDVPPDPLPPGPGPGQTWGDTHLATFDGLSYDFQVVGEYTLVRSTKDDFTVQVRQVPVLGPKLASVNQAVATRIGGQRLTFTMENGAPVLRLDGTVIKGLPQLKAGSITGASTAYGGMFTLTYPDGTVLRVEQLGSYAINARVIPAASRRGTLVGLLGDADGSPANDLRGKDGATLTTTPADVNGTLASAWAVTPSTSLFDYAPGQTTASFTDPEFPAKDADAARLTSYSTAEETCRSHGITDAQLLHNCVLDLAVTNSFLFGTQYSHAQHVLAARAALSHSVVDVPTTPTFWIDGAVPDTTSELDRKFDGKAGDVIWVGYDQSCKMDGFVFLFDPSGKQLHGAACDFGRFVLPANGTYVFKASNRYGTGPFHFHVPVETVRADRHQQISYGQPISGTIEQWAAHDVYTWTAKAGDLIVLSGEGCLLPVHTMIVDQEGLNVLGPDCRVGTYYKVPKDGTYQLVVNGYESTHGKVTGPYHFVFQGGKIPIPH